LRERNVLTLDLPNAESPAALKLSEDTRLLGLNVQWMQIERSADQQRLNAKDAKEIRNVR
jgi:hypothetical protein